MKKFFVLWSSQAASMFGSSIENQKAEEKNSARIPYRR